MGRESIRSLRQKGVSGEDIEAAKEHQERQRKSGAPVLSIAAIVGVAGRNLKPRPGSPAERTIDFTRRALRKRGLLGQAALLADQAALGLTNPYEAEEVRAASAVLKKVSKTVQLEFDFFRGGNMSIAFQYQDAVTERLRKAAPSLAKQHEALAVLWQICRHLGWQSYECSKTAADLCGFMGMKAPNMATALDLLEQVGAIRRVKRGRVKIITVTPEGAFRGDLNHHAEAVQRYKLEVIEGGKAADGQIDLEDYLNDR